MIISKPGYYDSFRCIASACPDSCCKEWSVQVDAQTAAFYQRLDGPLGDRLRQVLSEDDGEIVMSIIDGRCPMWQTDGLCRIQAQLGEDALCQVCQEFPRLRHDYGDFLELGLELSCPEAARLILNAAPAPDVVTVTDAPGTAEYDTDAMDVLMSTRSFSLELLETDVTVEERLTLLLLYGYQAQEMLDGAEEQSFSPAAALEAAEAMGKSSNFSAFISFFQTLEQLTPQWGQVLKQAVPHLLPDQTIPLARYLIQRYWLQAVSDYDLISRVKFILISCILVGSLPGSYADNAQLFSKEIENDTENVDALLDAAYTESAFTDEHLLGFLLIPFSN